MQIDKEYVREQITEEIALKIVEDLGATPTRKEKDNYRFNTICHGGDSDKLYYLTEKKIFHCHTCCGSLDIYELVMKVKQCPFPEALEFVASYVGGAVRREGFIFNDLSEDWALIRKYRMLRKSASPIKLPTHNEKILEMFQKLYYYKWFEEFITEESMEKFKISYDVARNRIIIPHFDIDGNLIGIKGRALQQADIDAGYKYLPIVVQGEDFAFEQKYNLYGLNKTKDAIKRLKKIMLFESEKSVLQCEGYYGDNNFTVATCNSSISPFQKQIILGLGVEEIFIAFDRQYTVEDSMNKTPEYLRYCDKLLKLANMFSPFARVYIIYDAHNILPYKASPSDMGKDVLQFLMKNKHEVKTKEE